MDFCFLYASHLFPLDDGIFTGENIVFVLGSYNHQFLCVSLVSPSFVTMSSSKPTGVGRVNRWSRNSAVRLGNFYYESLPFSQKNNFVLDEETVKPGRPTDALENAGIDPDTMKVRKWHQETTRKGDVSHLSFSSRVGDVFLWNDQDVTPSKRANRR